MDVDSFLGGLAVKSAPASVEPPPEPEAVASDLTKDITPSERDSVSRGGGDIVTDVTPAGIEVAYQSRPKRLYQVRPPLSPNDAEADTGEMKWITVPSVTTVLDILNKPALVWYGMRQGVQGVIDLFDRRALSTAIEWVDDKEILFVVKDEGKGFAADEPAIVKLLTEHKLTVNHRRDQAADRGTNVHDALEAWGVNGELPNPEDFPETERGYVQGLVKFLDDVRPIPVRQEVMVGSVEHGFAGRFDLVAHVHESEVTTRCYPKRADKRETIEAGTLLLDLKTSKGTYKSHHLQLAAYELAAVECGYDPTNAQAIIHVQEDGKYELVFSNATGDQFLAIRRAYEALERLDA